MNRSAATIEIGGIVPRSLIDKLTFFLWHANLCDLEGGTVGEYPNLPKDYADFIDGQLASDEGSSKPKGVVLSFSHSDAPGGAFQELEDFLEANKISFVRWNDSHPEWDSELKVFRPDLNRLRSDEDVVVASNLNHEALIPIETLRSALGMTDLKGFLDRYEGVGEELPPFRINENA